MAKCEVNSKVNLSDKHYTIRYRLAFCSQYTDYRYMIFVIYIISVSTLFQIYMSLPRS